MDPPPPGTAGATTSPTHGGFTDPTPTPTPQAKLRLLCSYGLKADPSSPDSNLQDLKSETWFFDAFRNGRRFADSGTGTGTGPAEGQAESEGKCGVESVSGGPELVVLETSSSFGSTGSSASASNLPAIRVGGGGGAPGKGGSTGGAGGTGGDRGKREREQGN
ncbi:hypothetical protein Ancab_034335 [Ancistrocladus abbreviatus]